MELVIAVLAGVICGLLNTLASSGSALTLPLLMFMGLSPLAANATNRVPVLIGALVAVWTFAREGAIHWPTAIRVLIPSSVGALLGTLVATQIDADKLKLLINIAVLVALLLLFIGLKKAITQEISSKPRYRWQEAVWLFLVGVWLGFIVLDGATYLLLVLVLGLHLPFVQANAYKSMALVVSSALALSLFAVEGDIDWTVGGLMGLGSVLGGYAGAKLAMHAAAKSWAFRVLVTVIVLELIHMSTAYLHHWRFADVMRTL